MPYYEVRTAPEIKVRRITDGLTFVRGQRHYMRAPSQLILKDAALVKTELQELPAGAVLLDPEPVVDPDPEDEPEDEPAEPAPPPDPAPPAETPEPPRRPRGRPRKHPRPE